MSRNYKTELIQKFQEQIIGVYGAAEAERITDVLTIALEDYEVTERCGALVPYDDENERILKRYLACLFIDGKSEKTIKAYRRTIIKMTECLQKKHVEIGPYDIRLFLAYEKSRGVSNTTLENTRANLSAFFQWLTVEELVDRNPCMNIKPIKCPDRERFPLSSVELDALRIACNGTRERAMIELLVSSGVRVSELTGLDVEDISIPDLEVHVRNGKGGKDRTTYISEVARTHLSKYVKEHGITSGPLFVNGKHNRLRPGGVRFILNRIAERAGVENVHPHRFRRTFATSLADRGMQVQEIMRLLGHTNINTTMEYVSMSDDRIRISYKQYTA